MLLLYVEKPKKAKTALQVWDEKQLYAILNKLEKYSVYLAVLIAVTTGMKLGKVCGLQWKNINLKNKILYVRKQLQDIYGKL
jgi:integrase